MRKQGLLLYGIWLSIASPAVAADGPLGIDHRLNFDESGIWARSNQMAVRNLSAVSVIGAALYEGNDTRLGRTFWKSTEAMVAANLAAEGLKRVTRRSRPVDGNDPNQWFGSAHDRSFPSGEVMHISAVVTPIVAEYGREHPAVWALAVLPVYVGAARLKAQAHWQTDVLAGVAMGVGIGYYEHTQQSAWFATVLPTGLTVGIRTRF